MYMQVQFFFPPLILIRSQALKAYKSGNYHIYPGYFGIQIDDTEGVRELYNSIRVKRYIATTTRLGLGTWQPKKTKKEARKIALIPQHSLKCLGTGLLTPSCMTYPSTTPPPSPRSVWRFIR